MMDSFIFTIAVNCKDHSMFAKLLFSRLPLTKLNVSSGNVHEGKQTEKSCSVGTYPINQILTRVFFRYLGELVLVQE